MSEILIILIKPKDVLVTFASCVINNSLCIGHVAIYTSSSTPDGFRLVYPEKALLNCKKIHCVHRINKKAGNLVTKAIIGKYKEIISKTR